MTSHYALGLSNLDWIGIVIICCSFIFIYVFEKHLLNINTEVKAIRELQEKRRYETSIIPAQPGYFIVRGVWESDTKIGSLEYEPIIAWRMLYASGTYDDSVHVYPINERWSLSHKDDLAIRRPSGSIYLPYNTFSFGSDTFDTEPRYMAHLERAKAKNDLDWWFCRNDEDGRAWWMREHPDRFQLILELQKRYPGLTEEVKAEAKEREEAEKRWEANNDI